MSGTEVQYEHGRGINYRALDALFRLRETRSGEVRAAAAAAPGPGPCLGWPAGPAPGQLAQAGALGSLPARRAPQPTPAWPRLQVEYDIQVQMLEIYNEALRDLLADTPGVRLDIMTSEASGENVPNVICESVHGTADVLRIMAQGARNRCVGPWVGGAGGCPALAAPVAEQRGLGVGPGAVF
jgi:hypothetical protein